LILSTVTRKPCQPYFSTSRVEAGRSIRFTCNWIIPLGSGRAEQLCQASHFWKFWMTLGVPNTVIEFQQIFLRWKAKGLRYPEWEQPDLRGATDFSFYTDDPMADSARLNGTGYCLSKLKNRRFKVV